MDEDEACLQKFGEMTIDETPVAKLEGKGVHLFMLGHTRIRIGRKSLSDLSYFISKEHLQIYNDHSNFFMICAGKNGIFVDHVFYQKNRVAIQLPKVCCLRFPSTAIRLKFESLVDQREQQNNNNNIEDPKVPALSGINFSTQNFLLPATNDNFHPQAYRDQKTLLADYSKPPFSCDQLIVKAISSAMDKQQTLSGILAYIVQNYPFYRSGNQHLEKTIRHTLLLNKRFVKVSRNTQDPNSRTLYRIAYEIEDKQQAFRKRRRRSNLKLCSSSRSTASNVQHVSSEEDLSSLLDISLLQIN